MVTVTERLTTSSGREPWSAWLPSTSGVKIWYVLGTRRPLPSFSALCTEWPRTFPFLITFLRPLCMALS